MNTHALREVLFHIQSRDPDGHGTREPTDADRDAFKAWVLGMYGGEDLWRIYSKTAWMPTSDV